jgi:hypothetical protein
MREKGGNKNKKIRIDQNLIKWYLLAYLFLSVSKLIFIEYLKYVTTNSGEILSVGPFIPVYAFNTYGEIERIILYEKNFV